jgi:hypothetical protein
MAYSLLARKEGPLDWEKFRNSFLSISDGSIEMFPIMLSGEENESCLGISITTLNIHGDFENWTKIVQLIKICSSEFSLLIYDLYSGLYISDENLLVLKKNILG